MKNKVIIILVIFLIIFFGFIASIDFIDNHKRVHQHLAEEKKQGCNKQGEEFCTHLPIVNIETNNQDITISNYGSEEVVDNRSNIIVGEFQIIDNKNENNHKDGTPQISSKVTIKYRGYSSLYFDKKSYKIKLVNSDLSSNKNCNVMGMGYHDEWVLNGPFLDKTLIRNYMCMNISGEIMKNAPDIRFCELFVDGEYKGVYVAMENIDYGMDRVNITQYNEGDEFSSYIIRADRDVDQENKIENFSKYSLRIPANTAIEIIYPPKKELYPELIEYISEDFSRFEKTLYSFDYNDKNLGYRKYINVDSFVDYFIINEFFKNYDAGRFSTFFYKDIRGKINIGPVWDFNNACDNYMEVAYDEKGFNMVNGTWYFMLTKDEKFINSVISRYKQLRKTYLSDEYLINYIDETVDYLGDAVKRNYDVWGYSFEQESLNVSNRLEPVDRNVKSYEESIVQLKTFIRDRGAWLDENIEILKQYCHESRTKKFNH